MTSRDCLTADDMLAWVHGMAAAFEREMERLSQLDGALGDGDHGSSMVRAFRAVVAKLDAAPPADSSALLQTVGMTLISVTGGATGPLFGTIFLEAAKIAKGKACLEVVDLAAMACAAAEGVMKRGGAKPGEKTMVDALVPAADALQAATAAEIGLPVAAARAAAAAQAGAEATAGMLASKGRRAHLGERSLGHQDAGANSIALIFAVLAQVAAEIAA